MYLCCDAWHHEGQCLHRTRSSEQLQSLRLAFHLEDLPWLDWPPRLPYPIVPFSRSALWSQSHDRKGAFEHPLGPWHMLGVLLLMVLTELAVGKGLQSHCFQPRRWFSQENTRSPDLLLLRIAEEQAGCCLRFKPRHAFSPERSGIEAGVEGDTRPAMFGKRREVVRLSGCPSMAKPGQVRWRISLFTSWRVCFLSAGVVSNFTPLLC